MDAGSHTAIGIGYGRCLRAYGVDGVLPRFVRLDWAVDAVAWAWAASAAWGLADGAGVVVGGVAAGCVPVVSDVSGDGAVSLLLVAGLVAGGVWSDASGAPGALGADGLVACEARCCKSLCACWAIF